MTQRFRFGALVAALLIALTAGAPAGAISSPPAVSSARPVAPPALGQVNAAEAVAVGFDGSRTVEVWGTGGLLQLERFDAELRAVGPPLVLASGGPEGGLRLWEHVEIAVGGGQALVVAKFNDGFTDTVGIRAFLVSTAGVVRRVPLDRACPSQNYTPTDRIDAAWNGTRFLVAANCQAGSLRVFTVSSVGTVRPTAVVPGGGTEIIASDVSVASIGGGFAVAYEHAHGPQGYGNILIRRFDEHGEPVGAARTLDTNLVMLATAVTVSGSGGRFLAAWSVPAPDSILGTFGYRTLTPTGELGATRRINGLIRAQGPSLKRGPNGSWRLFYRDDPGLMGRTISSTLDVGPAQRIVALGNHEFAAIPSATATSGGAMVVATVERIPIHRRIRPDLRPIGEARFFGRYPVEQSCPSVAAGSNQYLVLWQELRGVGQSDLFAQRFSAAGAPLGGRITVSTAPAHQFCARAAWDGSKWLVAWTDHRNGNKDVFATTVGPSGAVSPSSGFPVSTETGSQQSPALAFNGTDFVVAWNDLRNGNQDIYAARVSTARVVRDPTGIAVSTAPDPGFEPTVSAAGSDTLVSWVGGGSDEFDSRIGVRVLRSTGTFRSDPRRIEVDQPAGNLSSTATSTRFVVAFMESRTVRTVSVDPATGVIGSGRDVDTDLNLDHITLVAAGNRFALVATHSRLEDDFDLIEVPFIGILATDRGTIASRTTLPIDGGFNGVASLSNGIALVAGHDAGRVVASKVA